MLTILLVAGILLSCLLLTSLALWGGAKLFKTKRQSFLWSLLGAFLLMFVNVAASYGLAQLDVLQEWHWIAALAAVIVSVFITYTILFTLYFGGSILRGMGMVLAHTMGVSAYLCLLFFVVKPWLMDLYLITSQSMAPTLLGHHAKVPCPHCDGQVSYRLPDDPNELEFFQHVRIHGICDTCGRITECEPQPTSGQMGESRDRIAVNKLITPKRWDLVVFRYPEKPELIYVSRLVGLPGEKVTLKQNEVWINGKKIDRPAELQKLELHPVSTDSINFRQLDEPPKERTWQLGSDDLFVLGDFSQASSDSRDWGFLPRSNVIGVATHVYWPWSRIRSLRQD